MLPTFSILTAFVATIAATDIYLPSMPNMVSYFGVTDYALRMTIPAFFIGSFIMAPLWGTVSDHIGRRPTILIGLSLFLVGTMMCTFASSFDILLLARFVQGMGSIVVPVVGWAAVQDLYDPTTSVKVISYFGTVMTICPMVAPTLGGFIDVSIGWRWNFALIAILATISLITLVLVMTEPRPMKGKKYPSLVETIHTYSILFTHRSFLCALMIFAFLAAGEWCFLTLGPFYFGNTLHLSPDVFGLYITICAFGYIFGTLFTPRVLMWVGLDKTILVGLWIALIGCSILVISMLLPWRPELFVVVAVGIYFFGASLTWGPSTSKALRSFDTIRGAASAVRSIILTIFAAMGGFIGSRLDYSTLIPLTIFLSCMVAGAFLMFYLDPKEEP